MAYQIPETEPDELRAGDTWEWRRVDLSSDYPAATWTLVYNFRNPTSYFDITADADGDDFSISVPAATTATYTDGSYNWSASVTDGTDKFTVGDGVTNVLADVSSPAPYDSRSLPQRLLDAVDAILENRATKDQIDLVNGASGDSSASRDPAFLLTFRSKLQYQVKLENGEGGLKNVNVRFGHV